MLARSLAFSTAFFAVAVQTPAEQEMFFVAWLEIVTAACAGVEAAIAAKAANPAYLLITFSQPFLRGDRYYAQREQNGNVLAHRSR
jgi:hypothetical protein